ncbi:MAG: nucleoside-diphosphate kinase [Defluviitoga tunisiensis]|uniref:Nucleoside diphosphate kinase n=1 Tax=Defluviitoga tunisiensis TaxID=1006576 RepID=A0A0C7NNZ0_DEFTU|nr:nucleoside-diphosphate kinase [Defluviitoga tunisiensis]MDD3600471.1 nucleoside-diphosphate kinase [Defluviitoga tunisiensis]MDY0379855.1 nucleoside-diphosphate kinase [Defluviitoga tunisiensis]CEP77627.1 nucleoside-diphosphate kinase [Defluviitoga tunisiensis]HOB55578.1 nucleoside-diphosphate kinase [Defluviitoga tunisiensis]HOK16086.1 nucleoside-diphosphate kinase [Defluviitoga tunisiensis]
MIENQFIMIKPNAIKRGLIGNIIEKYEKKGLKIIALKLIQMKASQARALYKEHENKDFYQSLIDFVLSGPVIVMIVQGPNAVQAVRTLNGATNPLEADGGSIRGQLGLTITKNIVHASDSVENAKKEWKIFFDDQEIINYTLPYENEL